MHRSYPLAIFLYTSLILKKCIFIFLIIFCRLIWYPNFHDNLAIYTKRNASNTPSNTYFSTHSLWLVEIHIGPTKFIWDLHDLVRPMWIWTNQRECVENCVLEGMLLAFLIYQTLNCVSLKETLIRGKFHTHHKNHIFWYLEVCKWNDVTLQLSSHTTA